MRTTSAGIKKFPSDVELYFNINRQRGIYGRAPPPFHFAPPWVWTFDENVCVMMTTKQPWHGKDHSKPLPER